MIRSDGSEDVDETFLRLRCATCGAAVLLDLPNVGDAEIRWEEELHRFVVSIALDIRCHSCCAAGHNQPQGTTILNLIPVVVAERSRCSCGATLVLGDHTLRKSGEFLEFEAEYVCDKCQRAEKTVLRSVGKALRSLWRTTRRIELGPTGVSYEKSDGQ